MTALPLTCDESRCALRVLVKASEVVVKANELVVARVLARSLETRISTGPSMYVYHAQFCLRSKARELTRDHYECLTMLNVPMMCNDLLMDRGCSDWIRFS